MADSYNPEKLDPQEDDSERVLALKIARILFDAMLGNVPLQAVAV